MALHWFMPGYGYKITGADVWAAYDGLDRHGLLNYRYRGRDPNHRDNVGLREAMRQKTPLIYLFGVVKGQYMPVWPLSPTGDRRLCTAHRIGGISWSR